MPSWGFPCDLWRSSPEGDNCLRFLTLYSIDVCRLGASLATCGGRAPKVIDTQSERAKTETHYVTMSGHCE
eukprot:scaffold10416_cov32-Tisochrysis_lutea.AAC.2